MKENNKNNKLGFTLLELLVVVLIIGILAAIALPQYNKFVRNTSYANMLQILKTVVTAEQSFYITNNSYTTDWNNLDISLPTYGSCRISGGRGGGNCKDMGSNICMCLFSDSVSIGFKYGAKVPGLSTSPSGYEWVLTKITINNESNVLPARLYCRENNLATTQRTDYHCKGSLKRNNWYGSWFYML